MRDKAEYLMLFDTYINRPGASNLREWLVDETDFFTAPASTRYHESYAGGLCEHSVNVYEHLTALSDMYPWLSPSNETLAITALLHDVCKVNSYKSDVRNVKVDGVWHQIPSYIFDEKLKYGNHGGKSVYLISKFIQLTDEEAIAIQNHMGIENGNYAIFDAFRAFPLAFLLHTADMASTIPALCPTSGLEED